jgi:aconitate hydratase
MIIPPSKTPEQVEVVRGPNIKPFPLGSPPDERIVKKVLLKVEDNITTDHIMPSNAKLLPFRSNIPYLAQFCLAPCDEGFSDRAKQLGGGIIIGGENYGQGSSREHAALAPLYLGVKVIITKSFARIHKANLINSGIIPLTFKNAEDYDKLTLLDELVIEDAVNQLKNRGTVIVKHAGGVIETNLDVSQKELDMLLYGGKINMMKGTENDRAKR